MTMIIILTEIIEGPRSFIFGSRAGLRAGSQGAKALPYPNVSSPICKFE
jgi:hypothetical protein